MVAARRWCCHWFPGGWLSLLAGRTDVQIIMGWDPKRKILPGSGAACNWCRYCQTWHKAIRLCDVDATLSEMCVRQNQDFHFLDSEVRRNTSHLLDNVCKKREVFVALLAVIVSFQSVTRLWFVVSSSVAENSIYFNLQWEKWPNIIRPTLNKCVTFIEWHSFEVMRQVKWRTASAKPSRNFTHNSLVCMLLRDMSTNLT